MPFSNLPKSQWAKMERCVTDVMKSGKDKQAAIAICYTSLTKGKALTETVKSFEVNCAPGYQACNKSVMDAPNLRGDDAQKCVNCRFAQPIVTDDAGEFADIGYNETAMRATMALKDASIALICTQFDFITDPDFVCDGYEQSQPAQDAMPIEADAEKESDLSVFKQADGSYRWVGFTTSAYQDRDGETITQAALEADTERMNAEKEFGALDWWHTPVIIGSCDFSAMHGRIRIESGVFADNWVGERIAEHAKEFGMSIAFKHTRDNPDAQGVYTKIKTFRRAILPRGKESNLLTQFVVGKENPQMITDKIKELVARFGGDDQAKQKVDELLNVAAQTDKAAETAGLAFKEATVTPEVVAPVAETPESKPEATPINEQPGMFVSDMTPEEFDAHVAKAATAILSPIITEIGAMVKQLGDAQTTALKESGATITAQFAQITEKQAAIDKRLAALEGNLPRGYRASVDPGTVVADATKLKELKPTEDANKPKWIGAEIMGMFENGGTPQNNLPPPPM